VLCAPGTRTARVITPTDVGEPDDRRDDPRRGRAGQRGPAGVSGGTEPVTIRALACPATERDPGEGPSEATAWTEAYGFDGRIDVPGVAGPVRYTDDGLALAVLGIGKTSTATAMTSLCRSPRLDLSRAYVLSAGIAGADPAVGTLGAVFLADAIVDWDLKQRWAAADAPGTDPPMRPLPFRDRDFVYRPDDRLLAAARTVAEDVDLASSPAAREHAARYDGAATDREPFVGVGATVCGDEFWHGETLAAHVQWLVDGYDAGTYATTEAEDAATAAVLAEFGHADRHLSVRGVSNFDRPAPGEPIPASLDDYGGVDVAIENTFRVASAVADRIVGNWGRWRDGPPALG